MSPLPFAPLRRALVRRPTEAVDTPEQVQRFRYRRARSLDRAQASHDAFVTALTDAGVTVERHDDLLPGLADAVFVCDPALITAEGAIALRMARTERRAEVDALTDRLAELGVRLLGEIRAPGTAEGGDCLWLDENTLAVGEGYRTNPEGIAQLQSMLSDADVISMPLPHFQGPEACLHLQSLVSFARADLAVAHLELAPVRLVKALTARQVRILPLPTNEFDSLGCNFLCVAPNRVILPAGNPQTAALLRGEGVQVTEIDAPDLMWVGSGGPTCLTLPLTRGSHPAG